MISIPAGLVIAYFIKHVKNNVMTLRSITRSFQHKIESSHNKPNYAEVIKYLNEIQDSENPARKTRARLIILYVFILMLVAISVTVAVVSNLP
jgi:hypothetical protein